MAEEHAFWAEKVADEIKARKHFHFSEAPLPKLKQWSVKSSSSLSGVLHIGRLSDLIRSEAVSRALEKAGVKQDFIYVTEDMDPFRKVPEGVPKDFVDFIGMPVSDIPDPFGCHKSYAAHFVTAFFDVLAEFLFLEPKIYSMREEYGKGNFNDDIKVILKNASKVREIIQSKQDSKLDASWSPWKPICEKCGKLQTTVITGVDGLNVHYKCQDYAFEKNVAKGCGFEGKSNLAKANGKLVWKSEWAAQWRRWAVCSEGAGKEYESKNSAFWVNAEICEKILNFPAPVPIFYEHLMIDGRKMSASLGNVVYPKDWVEAARPEALKYLYMKRIMKSRNFSWRDVPTIELELDRALSSGGSKEAFYSSIKGRPLVAGSVDYSTVASLTPLFDSDAALIKSLSSVGLLPGSLSKDARFTLNERIKKARVWVEKYAPPEFRLSFLENFSGDQMRAMDANARKLLPAVAKKIAGMGSADEIQQAIFEEAKANGVQPKQLFKAIYLALTGKEAGPRAGLLILALGKEKCLARLGAAGS